MAEDRTPSPSRAGEEDAAATATTMIEAAGGSLEAGLAALSVEEGADHFEHTPSSPADAPPSPAANAQPTTATSSTPPPRRARSPTVTASDFIPPAAGQHAQGRGLDPILVAALGQGRDRMLLLRAEAELERFVSDPSSIRLPLSPPFFPTRLNSYQRLLLHRLADLFLIRRDLELLHKALRDAGVPESSWDPAVHAAREGATVVVLVKTEQTRLPATKLGVLVPLATQPHPSSLLPPTAPASAMLIPSSGSSSAVSISGQSASNDSSRAASPEVALLTPSSSAAGIAIADPSSSAAGAAPAALPEKTQLYKILHRSNSERSSLKSASRSASASASASGAASDSYSVAGEDGTDDGDGGSLLASASAGDGSEGQHSPATPGSEAGPRSQGQGQRRGGGKSSKHRKEMTLEEREAAYKEARERIFRSIAGSSSSNTTNPSSAGSSQAGEPSHHQHSHHQHQQPPTIQRPSSASSGVSRVSGRTEWHFSDYSTGYGYSEPGRAWFDPSSSGGASAGGSNGQQWGAQEYAQYAAYSSQGMGQMAIQVTAPMQTHPSYALQQQQYDYAAAAAYYGQPAQAAYWGPSGQIPSPALSSSSGSSFAPPPPPPQPSQMPQHQMAAPSSTGGYVMRFGEISQPSPPPPFPAAPIRTGSTSSSASGSLSASQRSASGARGNSTNGPRELAASRRQYSGASSVASSVAGGAAAGDGLSPGAGTSTGGTRSASVGSTSISGASSISGGDEGGSITGGLESSSPTEEQQRPSLSLGAGRLHPSLPAKPNWTARLPRNPTAATAPPPQPGATARSFVPFPATTHSYAPPMIAAGLPPTMGSENGPYRVVIQPSPSQQPVAAPAAAAGPGATNQLPGSYWPPPPPPPMGMYSTTYASGQVPAVAAVPPPPPAAPTQAVAQGQQQQPAVPYYPGGYPGFVPPPSADGAFYPPPLGYHHHHHHPHGVLPNGVGLEMAAGGIGAPIAGLGMEDSRRPPPRTRRELFDPNAAANSSGSVATSAGAGGR